eukprot:gb/GECG01015070.1/.p1 GENE.gb/GECG01015070.1/~~gb/GECG01015070.1/.p1  ORF type:complete len:973 (+),score=100.82 gb/GECG01015070.1/:1-2919(+)
MEEHSEIGHREEEEEEEDRPERAFMAYYFRRWKQNVQDKQLEWKQRVLGTAIRVHFSLLRSVHKWARHTQRKKLLIQITRACYARILHWMVFYNLEQNAREESQWRRIQSHAHERLKALRLRRVLQTWSSWEAKQKRIRHHIDELRSRRNTRILFQAFDAWKSLKEAKKEYKGLESTASAHIRQRRLLHGIRQWWGRTQEMIEHRRKRALADTYNTYHFLNRTYFRWKEFYQSRKTEQRNFATADEFHKGRLRSTYFSHWRISVRSVKVNRRLNTLALAFHHRKLLWKAFTAIKAPWEHEIEVRKMDERAPLIYERAVQRRCLRGLHRHMDDEIHDRVTKNLMRRVLRRWNRHLDELRTENRRNTLAHSHSENVLKKRAFQWLLRSCRKMMSLHELFEEIQNRNNLRVLRQMWDCWRQALRDKEKYDMAVVHYSRKLQNQFFLHWSCMSWANRSMNLAMWHWKMHAKAKAWAGLTWWHFLRQRQLAPARRAEKHHAHCLLAKTFESLKKYTEGRSQMRSNICRVQASRIEKCRVKCLLTWLAYAKRQRDMRTVTKKVEAYSKNTALLRALKTWRHRAYTTRMHHSRSQSLRACVDFLKVKNAVSSWRSITRARRNKLWRLRAAREEFCKSMDKRCYERAVRQWYDWFCRRNVLSMLYDEGDSFVTRRRLQQGFSNWTHFHRSKKHAEDLKNWSFQFYSFKLKRQVFDGWNVEHQECQKHLKNIRSVEQVWIAKQRKRFWKQWRFALVTVRYERKQWERAALLRQKLLASCCLQEFVAKGDKMYQRERHKTLRIREARVWKQKVAVRLIELFYLRTKTRILKNWATLSTVDAKPQFWSSLSLGTRHNVVDTSPWRYGSPPREKKQPSKTCRTESDLSLQKSREQFSSRAAMLLNSLTYQASHLSFQYTPLQREWYDSDVRKPQYLDWGSAPAIVSCPEEPHIAHRVKRRKPRVPSFIESQEHLSDNGNLLLGE